MEPDPGWGDFQFVLDSDMSQESGVVVQSQYENDSGNLLSQSQSSFEEFATEIVDSNRDKRGGDPDDIYAFYDAYDSYGEQSSNSMSSDEDSNDAQFNGLKNGDFDQKKQPGMATCELCGKVGVQHAFYSKTKRFCSMTCSRSAAGQKAAAAKRPKSTTTQSPKKPKVETLKSKKGAKKSSPGGGNSKKKSNSGTFDWSTYLTEINADAASVNCFKHSPMADNWEDIAVGMKVEVLNTDCDLSSNVFWIAQVVKIAGYKVLLRYEGFGNDSSHDFWSNLLKLDVHPVGWCATIGKPLLPPKSISNRRNNWRSFLVNSLTGAKTLPSDFQEKVVESMNFKLKTGMKLEVVDKMRVSRMRVAIVDDVVGGRMQLQYISSSEEDFWCHINSPLIHPCGWSAFVGHEINASEEYKMRSFTIAKTKIVGEEEASWELFFCGNDPPKGQGFTVGMKLEAIDPLNLASICVATVMKVLKNNYLMIGIDGSMAVDGSDWFCYHASSPCVFPAGFCELNNIELTPPRGYKIKFKWLDYLIATKSQAAPVKLFNRKIPKHGFKVGQKLEAVDLMEPHLVCVGTVTKVVGRLLRIHFDGWDKIYDQWIDCESPDLYPVGWCEAFNYALEPPKIQDPKPPPPVPVKPRKKKPKNQTYKGSRKKKKLPPQKKQVASNRFYKEEVSPTPPYTPLPAKSVAAMISPLETKPAVHTKPDLTSLISSPSSITPPIKTNIGQIHVKQEIDPPEKGFEISSHLDSSTSDSERQGLATPRDTTASQSTIQDKQISQIVGLSQAQRVSDIGMLNTSGSASLPSFSTFASSSKSEMDNSSILQSELSTPQDSLQSLSPSASVVASFPHNFNASMTGSSGGVPLSTSPVGSMQPFSTTINNLNIPHSISSNSGYGSPPPGRASLLQSPLPSPSSSPVVSARNMPPLSAICSAPVLNTISPSVNTANSMPPLTKRNFSTMPPLSTPVGAGSSAASVGVQNNIPMTVSNSGSVLRPQSLTGLRLPISTTTALSSISPAVLANMNSLGINFNSQGLSQYKGMQSIVSTVPTLSSPVQAPSNLTPSVMEYDLSEPARWGVLQVMQFLKENECGAYTESFRKQQIDGKKLLSLTKEQICNLTGMKVGPSLKIYEHIQQLKARLAQQ
ncbi:MBT domain-containing protein 1-like [Ptychodera flava]|uniref:MBT domain-containing protein 1-like n=1 Tax=Ptychodera flava TaxID=63121 RepID=UPI003969EA30